MDGAGFAFERANLIFSHHPVTGAKLDETRPNFAKFNSQPVCPTLSENLQFSTIRFISAPLPSLAEQSDLYSGSEEVRSSILLGSTKFSSIFCIFLNGLRGRPLPLTGPVPLCEEVLGSNRVTRIWRKNSVFGKIGRVSGLQKNPCLRLFHMYFRPPRT